MGRGLGKNFKLADAAAAEDALKSLMAMEEQNSETKVVKNDVNRTNKVGKVSRQPSPESAKAAAEAPVGSPMDSPVLAPKLEGVSTASRAMLLRDHAQFQVISSGGAYLRKERAFYGPIAEDGYGKLCAGKAFLFPSAVSFPNSLIRLHSYVSFKSLKSVCPKLTTRTRLCFLWVILLKKLFQTASILSKMTPLP